MATCPNPFVLNPGSDFTRKRKLDFQTTVRCLITMQIGSQKKNCWSFSVTILMPQRQLSTVQRFSRKRWNFSCVSSTAPLRTVKHTLDIDYRPVMAPVWTSNEIQLIRKIISSQLPETKGLIYLAWTPWINLGSRRYKDAVIQSGRKSSGCRAMADMIDWCVWGRQTIFIADRNYGSYNICPCSASRHALSGADKGYWATYQQWLPAFSCRQQRRLIHPHQRTDKTGQDLFRGIQISSK